MTFDLNFRSDGLIWDLLIDGVSTGYAQTTANWFGGPLWSPGSFSQSLAIGVHTIQVVVADSPSTGSNDPVGFFLNGNITSVNGSIVNDQNPNCANYSCCDDKCYWTVDGNNISSGRNIFGTLTDDDIRIISNGSSTPARGIIKGGNATTGGFFGWNTTSPKARVDVNCKDGNNPSNIFGLTSDIRFESLEPGEGNILVIDKDGYVYDSGRPLKGEPSNPDDGKAMKQEMADLKMQLAEMRRIMANSGLSGAGGVQDNTLYQNAPNPFDKETSIRYNITRMQQSAAIVIYDLNGRELKRYPVAKTGEGTVTINADVLQSGMYLYSLIVDGREADTKRMVMFNNK